VAFESTRFSYQTDELLFDGVRGSIGREIRRWRLLARAALGFDVVHFNFGHSIFPQAELTSGGPLGRRIVRAYQQALELRDLQLLRELGRGIAVTYQGDDARQGDVCRSRYPITFATEVDPDYYTPAGDERKRWRIQQVARFAHRIYALNPDLLNVLPARAEFVPYASVDHREWRVSDAIPGSAKTPLVVHAPTHRAVKGTRFIVEAVDRLRAEGCSIDLRLVEGVPHAESRRLCAQADLVVDQLLAGWYGALAVECMAMGRPLVCYVRDEDLHHIPRAMRDELPVIRSTPDTTYDVLKTWLTTWREALPDRGRAGRAYVEHWHDPIQIASRLRDDYAKMVVPGVAPDAPDDAVARERVPATTA
jgi:hypothetical protein